jgi:hypothetical protein
MKKKRKKIIIEEKMKITMKITMKKKGGENPGMHRTYFRDVTSGSTPPPQIWFCNHIYTTHNAENQKHEQNGPTIK